jgi:histidinol-phosphatase (PHP family)
VLDYVRAGLDAGLKILGISDHTPLPDGRWAYVRMDMPELDDYHNEIAKAKEEVTGIKILTAFECEYDPEYEAFYRETLLPRSDYLVGGSHWFPRDGEWHGIEGPEDFPAYADYLVAGIESGLFLFQAHPDLFAGKSLTWDDAAEDCSRRILAAAEAADMVLEINAYGIRKPWIDTPEGRRAKYPWNRFWKCAAEYDISVVINSDAHRPEDIIAEMDTALAIANEFNLPLADMQARLKSYRSGLGI